MTFLSLLKIGIEYCSFFVLQIDFCRQRSAMGQGDTRPSHKGTAETIINIYLIDPLCVGIWAECPLAQARTFQWGDTDYVSRFGTCKFYCLF